MVRRTSLIFAAVFVGASIAGLSRSAVAIPSGPFAYVSSLGSNTVSVIDTGTNTFVTSIAVGDGPFAVAVSPDARRVYVANAIENTVSVIDTSTNRVIATIPVGIQPIGVTVAADNSRAYVAVTGQGDGTGGVWVIDAALEAVSSVISLTGTPLAAAVGGGGRCLYVSSFDEVTVIDTSSHGIVGRIPLPSSAGPDSIALAPNAPLAYIVNTPVAGEVMAVKLAPETLGGSATTSANTQAVAVHPTNGTLYATDSSSAEVVLFDGSSLRELARIPLAAGSNPIGISLTPDGAKAYVAGNGDPGVVIVIDTATNAVTATIDVAGSPYSKGQFIVPAVPAPGHGQSCLNGS